jgi:hypothetical protein
MNYLACFDVGNPILNLSRHFRYISFSYEVRYMKRNDLESKLKKTGLY